MEVSEAMLGLSESLQKMVSRKFSAAFAAKDIVFSPTTLAPIRAKGGASFQLRYCPALKKKPQPDSSTSKKDPAEPKFDPFAEPVPELLVAQIPNSNPSHALVLNKYPVINNHFIIATKANKPQTDLLEEDDLSLTYACLRAWQAQESGRPSSRLFAFFNSGEHSGASQVHRHLQFLPVEDVASPDTPEWGLLVDRMVHRAHPSLPLFQDPSLPILHFSTPLGESVSPTDLYRKYVMLLRAAILASQSPGQPWQEDRAVGRDGKTLLSYNLAMTTDRLAICPRRNEAAEVPEAGPESSVAINGTILAGTLMVKDESEWNILRRSNNMLDQMLRTIGYPPAAWEQRPSMRI